MARLNPLPPDELDEAGRLLYGEMAAAMQRHQGEVQATTEDGALLGPFGPMLRFPQFGRGAWDYTKLFMAPHTLPESVRQVAILVVASRMGAGFELYSHEIAARDAGLTASQIAALAAGERPSDLDQEQETSYLVALTLVEGRQLPKSTYEAAVAAFAEAGVAELVFLVGSYVLLAIIINGYDLPVPDPP
jgi:4-carboxymuconolactone decarboxylase